MRVRLWFIILVFAGVLLVGLISLPFGLFMPLDEVFADGGIADNLLNVFAYGLLFFLIMLPMSLLGIVLIWQPRDDGKSPEAEPAGKGRRQKAMKAVATRKEHYSLGKLAIGVVLVWLTVLLVREVATTETPFPTSHADAARRAGEYR